MTVRPLTTLMLGSICIFTSEMTNADTTNAFFYVHKEFPISLEMLIKRPKL